MINPVTYDLVKPLIDCTRRTEYRTQVAPTSRPLYETIDLNSTRPSDSWHAHFINMRVIFGESRALAI